MKKLTVVISIVMVLSVSGLSVGCGIISTGSGNIVTKDYSIRDFDKVEIGEGIFLSFDITRTLQDNPAANHESRD